MESRQDRRHGSVAGISDAVIETALLLRQVFRLPLRQTEGLMNSLARVMKAGIVIPDFSSISKRSINLPRHVLTKAVEPGSVVIVNSNGLKVYGKDEWHQEKHDVPARRTWRKLHLDIDEKHQVLAYELTTPEVGDTTAVPDLLTQIPTPFKTFFGDGVYDSEPVSQTVLDREPDAKVVIPPHKTDVCSLAGDSQCDGHIQTIAQKWRIAWQRFTGYNIRNYVELAMQRYKRILATT
jgi:hypothetical protein